MTTETTTANHKERARILIIDDEEPLAELMAEVLGFEHDVELCFEAASALERLRTGKRYDLILCDVMMPRMSGPQFYEECARLEPGLSDRVIFLSGGAYRGDLAEFIGRVPNRKLEKPFDMRTLRQLVSESL